MGERKKVLSLGTVAMDIIIEALELPREDGFGFIESERLVPGGSAANVSVALARYGIETYQMGKIGEDNYGDEFRKTLIEDGVNDRFLITKPKGTTLHNYIVTVPGGKHCIFSNLGDSVTDLHPEEIPENILEGIDVFYTDLFSSRAAIFIAKLAKKKDIPVLYNMQCVPSFMKTCGIAIEEIEEMINLSTIFCSGQEGYFEMTGEKDYHKAIEIFSKRFPSIEGAICTAGDEGALWLDKKELLHVGAYPVDAVDTTGAGDCFLAGFIYSYFCEGMSKKDALQFASASAAIKCVQKGPRTRANVDDVKRLISCKK